MKKPLRLGDHAPNFELKTDNGSTLRLEEALANGPVVLIFYPGDRTPGCTVQLCAIRDDWEEFKRLGLQVLGVNHAGADSHRAFSGAHSFPFPLLVDEGKKTSAAYGAIRSLLGMKIIRRMVVGISADGVIRYLREGLPKNTEILRAMKPFAKA